MLTNVLLGRLGFDTEVRRLMMAAGPENVTSARDLARGIAAHDEPRILEALSVAHDSELPYRLPRSTKSW